MKSQVTGISTTLEQRIAELADLWSMPDLPASVSVCFSSRLKRALGRADGSTGRIVLAAFLANDPALCDVTLCHELAHLAAFRLVGASERPHGATWQRLMREAGCPSAVRLAVGVPVEEPPAARKAQRFKHYCPVCQFSRTAARRMPGWQCADCVAAGLEGHLAIAPVGHSH